MHAAFMHMRFLHFAHAYAPERPRVFTASVLQSMQYQSRDSDGCFWPPVRGTNEWLRSGYMFQLRPRSGNICTILYNVDLNLLGVPDG